MDPCPLLLPRSHDQHGLPVPNHLDRRVHAVPCSTAPNRTVFSFLNHQLASQMKITPPETGCGVNLKLGYPKCFAACQPAPALHPGTTNRPQASKTTSSSSVTERASAASSRTPVAASKAKTTTLGSDARVIVGYSDGSLASISMPPPPRGVPAPSPQREGAGRGLVRRLRRVDEGGGEGGTEAGITALCSVWAPFGLLAVAGDSDGRLGLWTTSALQSGR